MPFPATLGPRLCTFVTLVSSVTPAFLPNLLLPPHQDARLHWARRDGWDHHPISIPQPTQPRPGPRRVRGEVVGVWTWRRT